MLGPCVGTSLPLTQGAYPPLLPHPLGPSPPPPTPGVGGGVTRQLLGLAADGLYRGVEGPCYYWYMRNHGTCCSCPSHSNRKLYKEFYIMFWLFILSLFHPRSERTIRTISVERPIRRAIAQIRAQVWNRLLSEADQEIRPISEATTRTFLAWRPAMTYISAQIRTAQIKRQPLGGHLGNHQRPTMWAFSKNRPTRKTIGLRSEADQKNSPRSEVI